MNEVKVESREPIFVIGFPKSGNTWLARLLAELTQSNIAVQDPSDVVNVADNSPDRKGCYVIYKEHHTAAVEKASQHKVVYIVRDVRDVLLSWFFHCNRWASSDSYIKKTALYKWYFIHEILKSNEMLRGNLWGEFRINIFHLLRFFISGKYSPKKIGGWSDHVAHWRQQPGVVIVKYEALLKDTEKEVRRILDALAINVDDDILNKCILNQSFEKRKSEFVRSGDNKNAKFLRSGKAGGWRNSLPSSVVRKIELRHAHVMSELGYKLDFHEECRDKPTLLK